MVGAGHLQAPEQPNWMLHCAVDTQVWQHSSSAMAQSTACLHNCLCVMQLHDSMSQVFHVMHLLFQHVSSTARRILRMVRTLPSITSPSDRGHALCAHSSLMQLGRPSASLQDNSSNTCLSGQTPCACLLRAVTPQHTACQSNNGRARCTTACHIVQHTAVPATPAQLLIPCCHARCDTPSRT